MISQTKNVMNEKNMMVECDHPFILKLFTFYFSLSQIFFWMIFNNLLFQYDILYIMINRTFKDERKLYFLLEFIQVLIELLIKMKID